MKRKVYSTNSVGTIWYTYGKTMNFDNIKNLILWNMDLNVGIKTIKILEENIKETLCDPGLANDS